MGFLFLPIYQNLQAAKELYEEIKNGLVTKMSWAFTVAEDEYDRETRTRTITKIKKFMMCPLFPFRQTATLKYPLVLGSTE